MKAAIYPGLRYWRGGMPRAATAVNLATTALLLAAAFTPWVRSPLGLVTWLLLL